ncbi:MAG TPA: MBL fold metallo-hydrolase [Intrasporangium sp.]|uniref:MBL fold metallo-hydrolase n=1 Tax=Intrasporangium sp. TaxID=1925024 RepID=UPI002D768213|nr:MBL fold metallo-hydrolase [Intrasporangium sp.]HET7399957.1 MBL fold metallo-hydrolase [Intrasporangium sp.]
MFTEVADRVLVARYRQWDVTVGLVLGRDGALVVDTRASAGQGREVLDDVRAVAPGTRVTHVVNTHVHFDHTLGNAAFADARIHAHDNVARAIAVEAEQAKALLRTARPETGDPTADLADRADGADRADIADLLATPVRPPDAAFGRSAVIDLGDREVVLRYAGRGHTDGDIGVFVPDADCAFLGDLVEESAHPSLGADCWPLEWADTLRRLGAPLGPASVVLPGHGRPVDAGFVERQRHELRALATVIVERRLAGLSLEEASRTPDARLPYPLPWLADAFARGWEQLPRG